MTNKSSGPGPDSGSTTTRWETLPAVQTTRPQRGSSACSSATISLVLATSCCTASEYSDNPFVVAVEVVGVVIFSSPFSSQLAWSLPRHLRAVIHGENEIGRAHV